MFGSDEETLLWIDGEPVSADPSGVNAIRWLKPSDDSSFLADDLAMNGRAWAVMPISVVLSGAARNTGSLFWLQNNRNLGYWVYQF